MTVLLLINLLITVTRIVRKLLVQNVLSIMGHKFSQWCPNILDGLEAFFFVTLMCEGFDMHYIFATCNPLNKCHTFPHHFKLTPDCTFRPVKMTG